MTQDWDWNLTSGDSSEVDKFITVRHQDVDAGCSAVRCVSM